jgi:hypothetical protein
MQNSDCRKYCENLAKEYTTFQKINYLIKEEKEDFGYYGLHIFKPYNLVRIDRIFHSRFMENCVQKCGRDLSQPEVILKSGGMQF